MTLLLDAKPDVLGAQRPRISNIPPYASTTGVEAVELADLAGLELDPWQQWCLIQALGEMPDGQFAAFGVGIVVPRQNGKGGILEARELAGLFLLSEHLQIHSAHQFDTSQEAFERLVALIENTPELSKRVAKRGITRSHGSEGIKLRTGERIRFRTRTKGGGRGFTCDCLYLDEAMIIPDAFTSAVIPTLSARPNPQVWYTGSAVDQTIHEHGHVLARVRERGLRGDEPRLFFAEWSADAEIDELNEGIVTDPAVWAQANPALGIRITTQYLEDERREFGTNLRGFAVERLGVGDWPDDSADANRVITAVDWAACLDPESQIEGQVALALDMTPDRAWVSIAAAGLRADGLPHVELVQRERGSRWVAGRLLDLMKAHGAKTVYLDAYGPAESLGRDLEERGVDVTVVSAQDVKQACGLFYDAVSDGHRLRHLGQPELDDAIAGASTRPLGDAWAWARRTSDTDISPLVAATTAAWALGQAKPARARVVSLADIAAEMDSEEG